MTQRHDLRRRQFVAAGGAFALHSPFGIGPEAERPWVSREVPDAFAGLNLEIAGGSAPDGNLMESLAAMRPSHVRWPGGELANYWDWREQRAKPPDYSPKWAGVGVSMEQLAGLCRGGTEVVVVLNMLTDELQSQLEMLRALVQRRIPVKHVELGNEFFLGYDSKRAYARKFPQPAAYGAHAEQWAAAIRRAHPAMRLAAVGDWAPTTRGRGWNAALVPRAGSFDAITIHWYGKAVDRDNWSDFPHGVVAETVDRQQRDAEWLHGEDGVGRVVDAYEASIGQLLERVLPAVPTGLPIWLTEFNKARLLSQLNGTWLHGVIVGAMFMDLLSNSRIDLATLYNFVGPTTYAAMYRDADVMKEIIGAPSKIPVNSYSPSGLAFTLIAEALREVKRGQIRSRPQDRCRVALLESPTGPRLLAVNLSSRPQDALRWIPQAPKRMLVQSEAPFQRKAFTALPKWSAITSGSARAAIPPFSIAIFE